MSAIVDYGFGISAVDSGYVRPRLDAIHLVVEDGRAAIVDTGTAHSVPRVLAALAAKSIAPEEVDYVILTHVHLDHAGGAGLLMQRLPNATLTAHPRGARHMAEPSRLVAGTVAVYGAAEARRLYGDIVPVPADRILETPDGASIRLAGRELVCYDTPGHARHHVAVRDSRSGHVFTGDVFGMSYRELDHAGRQFIFATSSPVQFDPEPYHRSIDLVAGLAPDAVYLTHYGQLRDPAAKAPILHRQVDALAAIGRRWRDAGAERYARLEADVRALLLEEARRYGAPFDDALVLEVYGQDVALNAQGLVAWLEAMGSRTGRRSARCRRARERSRRPSSR
jgi:glyoxylase-like metal-dependent hydrolase (beta-lactamase superfamily II)